MQALIKIFFAKLKIIFKISKLVNYLFNIFGNFKSIL